METHVPPTGASCEAGVLASSIAATDLEGELPEARTAECSPRYPPDMRRAVPTGTTAGGCGARAPKPGFGS